MNTNNIMSRSTGILLLIGSMFAAGCQLGLPPDERSRLEPPANVRAIPGDNSVEILWRHSTHPRVTGYRLYRSSDYHGRYTYIGSTHRNYFTDHGSRNGSLYYYAVASTDGWGGESDLSLEAAYTIPRPEGFDVLIRDYRLFPERSGFEFSSVTLGPYDDQYADIFYEYANGTHYMIVWDDTDIRDMGPTSTIKDIAIAPAAGWSETKDVRLRAGHTYVVWTWDNHYAKFRVIELGPGYAVFDWAYQTVKGESLLKKKVPPKGERVLTRNAGR